MTNKLDFKNEDLAKMNFKMKDEIQILKKIDELRQISMLMENHNTNIKLDHENYQTEGNKMEFELLPDDFKLDEDENDFNKLNSKFKDMLSKMNNIRLKPKNSKLTTKKKKETCEMGLQADNRIVEGEVEDVNTNAILSNSVTKLGKFACWLCYKISNLEDAIGDTSSNKVIN